MSLSEIVIIIHSTLGNQLATPTEDLSPLPDLCFADVEGYAKNKSGCQNTAKAYKFFAEPGYLHEIKGKIYAQLLYVSINLFLWLCLIFYF